MLLLTLVGLGLQLAGAGVTAWGARLIWRQAATEGEHLLDPATTLTRRIWRRGTNSLLRWLGKPRSQTIQLESISSAASFGSARLSVSYPPLGGDLALHEAVAELDRRTQALSVEIGRTESRLLNTIEHHGQRHDDLSLTFDRYMSKQGEHARQRDLRGIRFEAAGLALVTLGAIVQALASLLVQAPGAAGG